MRKQHPFFRKTSSKTSSTLHQATGARAYERFTGMQIAKIIEEESPGEKTIDPSVNTFGGSEIRLGWKTNTFGIRPEESGDVWTVVQAGYQEYP